MSLRLNAWGCGSAQRARNERAIEAALWGIMGANSIIPNHGPLGIPIIFPRLAHRRFPASYGESSSNNTVCISPFNKNTKDGEGLRKK